MFKPREKTKRIIKERTKQSIDTNWFAGSHGQLLFSCSYNKWLDGADEASGYHDLTDYYTTREAYKRRGILLKHDVTEGRYFMTRITDNSFDPTFAVYERMTRDLRVLQAPHVQIVPFIDQPLRAIMLKPEISAIGYHDNLILIQLGVPLNMHMSVVHFYDLKTDQFLGHVTVEQQRWQWLECHISPTKQRILLRPIHALRQTNRTDVYSMQEVHFYDDNHPQVTIVPPSFAAHVFTFNKHLGDEVILCGHEQSIYKLILSHLSPQINAAQAKYDFTFGCIHQIRSSPNGDFLAVRTVDNIHKKEYKSNIVSIIIYRSMTVAMTIDAKGGYWPVSEVINLQVFPKFSQNGESVAIMKNHMTKRKLYVYKLPVAKVESLTTLSARVVKHMSQRKQRLKIPYLLQSVISTLS